MTERTTLLSLKLERQKVTNAQVLLCYFHNKAPLQQRQAGSVAVERCYSSVSLHSGQLSRRGRFQQRKHNKRFPLGEETCHCSTFLRKNSLRESERLKASCYRRGVGGCRRRRARGTTEPKMCSEEVRSGRVHGSSCVRSRVV